MCVTLYLHRSQAHRSVDFHPIINHFFRAWLWFTTGIKTKEWVAIHRKHHAKCETVEDPHSPVIVGISKVLWEGAELYKKEAKRQETIVRYGQNTPDDWLERNIYTPHSNKGFLILLLLQVFLFGYIGITIWAIQMMTIPFWAAGVINGLGHYWGYRNFECPDASTNLCPIGLYLGGEELHNNHHTYPTSAKFSVKPWEFDFGWLIIKTLSFLGLAKVKHCLAPITINKNKNRVDLETLQIIIRNRYPLITRFHRTIVLPAFKKAKGSAIQVENFYMKFNDVKFIIALRAEFEELWTKKVSSNNVLLEHLHRWCNKAEETNIPALKQFVSYIRACS